MDDRFKVLILILLALVFSAGWQPRAEEHPPRLKVLTFNIWGVIWDAEQRTVRARAIGKRIAELDPDIVAFQEVFEPHHRKALIKSLEENGYPVRHRRYFRRLYGSGLLFVSKFPINKVVWEPYVVGGGWRDIEWMGGKGIACLNLDTPWGPLEIAQTHAIAQLEASFDENGTYIGGDLKLVDRLLHMYQIDRFVREKRSKEGRSIIVAGDFNVSPDMLEYKFLMAITGFDNSFDALHPGENPSTYSPENVFVGGDESRIDHIFYKNYDGTSGFWLKPVVSRVEMTGKFKSSKTGEMINYSDHYAIWTEFEIVTDQNALTPSPAGLGSSIDLAVSLGKLTGYSDGTIALSPENMEAWRDFALIQFGVSYRRSDRRNQLLVPMADIIVRSQSAEPFTVTIPPRYRTRFEKIKCAAPCPNTEQ